MIRPPTCHQNCSNVWNWDMGIPRNGEQDLLERTEMRMLRWVVGIQRIEKIRTEVIRARAGVANISEQIR